MHSQGVPQASAFHILKIVPFDRKLSLGIKILEQDEDPDLNTVCNLYLEEVS